MKKRSKGWLVTIEDPSEEDYKRLRRGTHEYAAWVTREEGETMHLFIAVYYRKLRYGPTDVWPTATTEGVTRFSDIVDTLLQEGGSQYGERPRQGQRVDLKRKQIAREEAEVDPEEKKRFAALPLDEQQRLIEMHCKMWKARTKSSSLLNLTEEVEEYRESVIIDYRAFPPVSQKDSRETLREIERHLNQYKSVLPRLSAHLRYEQD